MADNAEKGTYEVLPHASRCCFARVLRRTEQDGRRVYRCSNCDLEVEGHDHRVLCACGTKLKTGVSAGLVCVHNDKPTPECNSRIVASTA
jgi:DNA-directed RNA polymerase subunit RPC12/RpoP